MVSAATRGDNTVRTWTPEGRPLATLRGHQAARRPPSRSAQEAYDLGFGLDYVDPFAEPEFFACAVSPDNYYIYSAGEDHTVRAWEVARGVEVGTVFLPSKVTTLRVDPRGSFLVCGTGEQAQVLELLGLHRDALPQADNQANEI